MRQAGRQAGHAGRQAGGWAGKAAGRQAGNYHATRYEALEQVAKECMQHSVNGTRTYA